ncbi:S1 RNA-binding domain-containing protein [Thalassoroseus pseudoceratinae]|uniref:S1 RNA-binding domain-containing protein n=1 Tax=Thalassoroseus pseudoceratinae TaxID=2713176 RepID=UPI00141D81C9|nr:S1 RNA-binding domain-containing protein [Thalassoroseus pseudoceratinae]
MSSDEQAPRDEDTQETNQQTATETQAEQNAPPTPTSPAESTTPEPTASAENASSAENSSGDQSVPPSEPTAVTPTPPEPVTPAEPANTPAEPTASSEPEAATPAEAASDEDKPRVQVGVTSGSAKAVPNLQAGDVQSATAPAHVEQKEGEQPASQKDPSAEVVPPQKPVDIPKADDLDKDLESQITSALSSSTSEPTANVPESSVAPAVPAGGETESATPATPPEDAAPKSEEELEPRQKLKAKVQSISDDDVFVDVGLRSPGLVSLRQFDKNKPPEVGQELTVSVDRYDAENGLIHVSLPRGKRKVGADWSAVEVGQLVDATVTKSNKGGLEVNISSLRGFLPASQVDLQYVSDLEPFVGQKLTVKVMEVNPAKRNLIVSRREYLKIEREEQEKELWEKLSLGQTFTGTIKTIKDYGAFVDIGGADGFLHIGEISWTRIRHPSDVLKEGQQCEVQVISLDADRKRIGLGMKQLKRNPWETVESTYPTDSTVSGRVTRVTDFGAFVELEPGVEGLVHISELDHRRVNRVADVLKEGDTSEFKVLEVDPNKKRISLSLKALKEVPEEFKKKTDEEMAPGGDKPYKRQRKGPLKGGYAPKGGGGKPSSGGGLFGNPDDF